MCKNSQQQIQCACKLDSAPYKVCTFCVKVSINLESENFVFSKTLLEEDIFVNAS